MTVIVVLVIAACTGGVIWNHQNVSSVTVGASSVVPYPPAAVASAITRTYTQGPAAAVRCFDGGVPAPPLGPQSFATNTNIGDQGEVSIARDRAGTLVTARTLRMCDGSHPNSHRMFCVGIVNGIHTIPGLRPSAAPLKRWRQNGLQGRIDKALARTAS